MTYTTLLSYHFRRGVICQRLGAKPCSMEQGDAETPGGGNLCYDGHRPEGFAVGRNLPVSRIQKDA